MVFHCIIHQEALCCEFLPIKFAMDAISTANLIWGTGSAHRQLQHFLEEIEAEYNNVYYSAVRRSKKGAVLKRFLRLLSEIDISLT
jgi:hypothetical protein